MTKSCTQEDESTRWDVLNKFAALPGARETDNRWYRRAKWRCTQEPNFLTILATETKEISATVDGKKPNCREWSIERPYEMALLWWFMLQSVACWVLALARRTMRSASFGLCLCEASPVDKELISILMMCVVGFCSSNIILVKWLHIMHRRLAHYPQKKRPSRKKGLFGLHKGIFPTNHGVRDIILAAPMHHPPVLSYLPTRRKRQSVVHTWVRIAEVRRFRPYCDYRGDGRRVCYSLDFC